MREIKFRAWDHREKEMLNNVQSTYDFTNSFYHNPDDEAAQEWCFQEIIDDDRYAVMQYTGLKDKNGVEMYEGDVVKVFKNGEQIIGLIKWSVVYLQYETHANTSFGNQIDYLIDDDYEYEVIGNIYQNNEMI